MKNDLKYWNAINLLPGIGPLRFQKLSEYFPSMEEAWRADLHNLKRAGLEKKIAHTLCKKCQEISPEKEWQKLKKEGIEVLHISDPNYPKLLSEIYDAPPLLYYKGNINKSKLLIGVVGTRKYTRYGKQITPEIISGLTRYNITIVSGMALGIDTIAHQSALENGAPTIAVLAGGLDKQNIYPYANRQLARKIEQNGTLVSGYPLGTPTYPAHFVQRNRIISGLSNGLLVTEAPAKSGALITARYALEQNREVFAVPGNINQVNSQGTNNLISEGAKLVSSATDILDEFELQTEPIAPQNALNNNIVLSNKEERELYKYISSTPVHIDKLIERSKLEASVVSATLVQMEIEGKVINLGGMMYIRCIL